MEKPSIKTKKKLIFYLFLVQVIFIILTIRVIYIQTIKSQKYQQMAYKQQTRDRLIAPKRGEILDRNMNVIATNQTVASISVIHSQIKNPEEVAKILAQKLDLNYDTVLKKVNKNVALERIKIKVDKNLADEIRELNLPGVVVDEDIKRVYPFNNMASQVIGFVGKDNQGIIGLEAKYDKYLKGVHLNDSKFDTGSKKDRHDSIGKGVLGEEFFIRFMNDSRFDNIPIILETIDDSIWKEEIEYLYSLIK